VVKPEVWLIPSREGKGWELAASQAASRAVSSHQLCARGVAPPRERKQTVARATWAVPSGSLAPSKNVLCVQ